MNSKLPDVGTTIFTVMSKLAHEHQAINLAQGFPGFKSDTLLSNLVTKAINEGYNQYAPMPGTYNLREKVVQKINTLYNSSYHPETDITITAGATQAIYTAIGACIHPDDEVILLKPAYDCYEPAIRVHGGKPISIQLEAPDYKVDWNKVQNSISLKTKMIIINTPHNPTGTVLDHTDMNRLSSIVDGTDIIIISDEVYEHIIFDNLKHQSVARYTTLRDRSFITASFGKTFHNTGWKIGYILGPEFLMKEFRKVHQFNVFSVHHPSQRALATYLEDPSHYLKLGDFYQQKRDHFNSLLKDSRFKIKPSSGTYFQLLDYSEITDENDVEFAKRLTIDYKVASIPTSVFNQNNRDFKMLRFCFAKENDELKRAAEILCAI